MSSPPPSVQGLEADALAVVQARGEASVREVMADLERAADSPRAYTTYMTTLARLHKKGLLTRRREGKTDLYHAVHTREEYADLRARDEVEHLVDAFGDVALGLFARQIAELDPERRAALEKLAREQ
jgi:predicted transcriptional regulator